MADTVKKVEILIGAKDTSGNVFNSLERRLGGIKRQFGRRGLFGDLGEILTGGGVIAGVTYLAKAIGEAAKQAGDLAARFRAGELSTRDMTAELTRQVPVLGQMIQMWDQIGEAAAKAAGASQFQINREGGFSSFFKIAAESAVGVFDPQSAAVMRGMRTAGDRDDEKKLAEDIGKKMADATEKRRSTIRGELERAISSEQSTQRINSRSGIGAEEQKVFEELQQRINRLNEAMQQLSTLAPAEAEERRKALRGLIASAEAERNRRLKAIATADEEERTLQLQKAVNDAREREEENRRAIVGAMLSGASEPLAFPGFAPLQESRFGTGTNDAARETIRNQWQDRIEKLMQSVEGSARDMADVLQRNLDLTNVGALLG